MLLSHLVDYAKRLSSRPDLYAEATVRYHVELGLAGQLLSPKPTDTADSKLPGAKYGARRLMPQIRRQSGVKPVLFASNAEYTFALSRKETGAKWTSERKAKHAKRVQECHAAYLAQVRDCARATNLPEVAAVEHFLTHDPLDQLDFGDDFDRGAAITFCVEGVYPADLKDVQIFWSNQNRNNQAPGSGPSGNSTGAQCLVCGRVGVIAGKTNVTIKGVADSALSGAVISSANNEAFLSRGLTVLQASQGAPTCAKCVDEYTRALNDLLSRNGLVDGSHFQVSSADFVFWTKRPSNFSFRGFLASPRAEQVHALLKSSYTGRQAGEVEDNAFYAAALSANQSRIVVRDWLDSTIEQIRANLGLWFARQRIVDESGEFSRFFGVMALAAAAVGKDREGKSNKVPPWLAMDLMQCVLTGKPLPFTLLHKVICRIRAGRDVTHAQAALVRLIIHSQEGQEVCDTMETLDIEQKQPAYLCGRLLAVLERAQYQAIKAKATVVDRFFGAASVSPGLVYPTLLRLTQSHLAKLARDNPGAKVNIENEIQEILGGLSSFPASLALKEQGLFVLGYYHQRAAAQATRAAAIAAKKLRIEKEKAKGGEIKAEEETTTGEIEEDLVEVEEER